MDLDSAHAYVLQVFVPGDPFGKNRKTKITAIATAPDRPHRSRRIALFARSAADISAGSVFIPALPLTSLPPKFHEASLAEATTLSTFAGMSCSESLYTVQSAPGQS